MAIRDALERYSTWSYSDQVDLADSMCLVDYGDVDDPDGEGGHERVAAGDQQHRSSQSNFAILLGGDNAATWHALRALAQGDLDNWGLITLDAHLDMRDGRSNGSPVRQLLEEGLDGHHVVQVGVADFSNSAVYAQRARDAGITVIPRDALRHEPSKTSRTRAHWSSPARGPARLRGHRPGRCGSLGGAGLSRGRPGRAAAPTRCAASCALITQRRPACGPLTSPRSTLNSTPPTSARFAWPRCWYSRRSAGFGGDSDDD